MNTLLNVVGGERQSPDVGDVKHLHGDLPRRFVSLFVSVVLVCSDALAPGDLPLNTGHQTQALAEQDQTVSQLVRGLHHDVGHLLHLDHGAETSRESSVHLLSSEDQRLGVGAAHDERVSVQLGLHQTQNFVSPLVRLLEPGHVLVVELALTVILGVPQNLQYKCLVS